MSDERKEALKTLNEQLTPKQKELLRMVITTADVQGDYICSGGEDDSGSVWSDDINNTLWCLAHEFLEEE